MEGRTPQDMQRRAKGKEKEKEAETSVPYSSNKTKHRRPPATTATTTTHGPRTQPKPQQQPQAYRQQRYAENRDTNGNGSKPVLSPKQQLAKSKTARSAVATLFVEDEQLRFHLHNLYAAEMAISEVPMTVTDFEKVIALLHSKNVKFVEEVIKILIHLLSDARNEKVIRESALLRKLVQKTLWKQSSTTTSTSANASNGGGGDGPQLNDDTAGVRIYSVWAIVSLCQSETNHGALVQNGVIRALVSVLAYCITTDSRELLKQALTALLSIAENSLHGGLYCKKIRETKGTEALGLLLQRFTFLEEETLHLLLMLLTELSRMNPSVQPFFSPAMGPCFAAIVSLLYHPIFGSLAMPLLIQTLILETQQREFISAGGLRPLFEFLSMPPDFKDRNDRADEHPRSMLHSSLIILTVLTNDEMNSKIIGERNFLVPLTNLLRRKTPTHILSLVLPVVEALLLDDPRNCAQFVTAGGMERLSSLLTMNPLSTSPSSSTSLFSSSSALKTSSSSSSSSIVLDTEPWYLPPLDEQRVKYLLETQSSSSSSVDDIQEEYSDDRNSSTQTNYGSMPITDETKIQEDAIAILTVVLESKDAETFHAQLLRCNILSTLMRVLGTAPHDLVQHALGLLTILCGGEKGLHVYRELERAQALPLFLQLLQHPRVTPSLKSKTALALSAILMHMQSHEQIRSLGGVLTLLWLVHAKKPRIQYNALTSLFCLSAYYPSLRDDIIQTGGLHELLRLLYGNARTHISIVRVEAVKVIANLSISAKAENVSEFAETSIACLLELLCEPEPSYSDARSLLSKNKASTDDEGEETSESSSVEKESLKEEEQTLYHTLLENSRLLKIFAAITLENISLDDEVLEAITEHSGITKVMDHLLTSPSVRLRYEAARLLSIWATHEDCRRQCQMAKGRERLQEALSRIQALPSYNKALFANMRFALHNVSVPVKEELDCLSNKDNTFSSDKMVQVHNLNERDRRHLLHRLAQIEKAIQSVEVLMSQQRQQMVEEEEREQEIEDEKEREGGEEKEHKKRHSGALTRILSGKNLNKKRHKKESKQQQQEKGKEKLETNTTPSNEKREEETTKEPENEKASASTRSRASSFSKQQQQNELNSEEELAELVKMVTATSPRRSRKQSPTTTTGEQQEDPNGKKKKAKKKKAMKKPLARRLSLRASNNKQHQLISANINNNKKVQEWSVEEVAKWLFEQDMAAFAPLFQQHKVDGERLTRLSEEDLIKMGLNQRLRTWRKGFLQNVQKLHQEEKKRMKEAKHNGEERKEEAEADASTTKKTRKKKTKKKTTTKKKKKKRPTSMTIECTPTRSQMERYNEQQKHEQQNGSRRSSLSPKSARPNSVWIQSSSKQKGEKKKAKEQEDEEEEAVTGEEQQTSKRTTSSSAIKRNEVTGNSKEEQREEGTRKKKKKNATGVNFAWGEEEEQEWREKQATERKLRRGTKSGEEDSLLLMDIELSLLEEKRGRGSTRSRSSSIAKEEEDEKEKGKEKEKDGEETEDDDSVDGYGSIRGTASLRRKSFKGSELESEANRRSRRRKRWEDEKRKENNNSNRSVGLVDDLFNEEGEEQPRGEKQNATEGRTGTGEEGRKQRAREEKESRSGFFLTNLVRKLSPRKSSSSPSSLKKKHQQHKHHHKKAKEQESNNIIVRPATTTTAVTNERRKSIGLFGLWKAKSHDEGLNSPPPQNKKEAHQLEKAKKKMEKEEKEKEKLKKHIIALAEKKSIFLDLNEDVYFDSTEWSSNTTQGKESKSRSTRTSIKASNSSTNTAKASSSSSSVSTNGSLSHSHSAKQRSIISVTEQEKKEEETEAEDDGEEEKTEEEAEAAAKMKEKETGKDKGEEVKPKGSAAIASSSSLSSSSSSSVSSSDQDEGKEKVKEKETAKAEKDAYPNNSEETEQELTDVSELLHLSSTGGGEERESDVANSFREQLLGSSSSQSTTASGSLALRLQTLRSSLSSLCSSRNQIKAHLQHQRTKIVHSILELEERYVELLKVVIRQFRHPLLLIARSPHPFVADEEVHSIFLNLNVLFANHKLLWTALKHRIMERWSHAQSIAACFNALPDLFAAYEEYIENYDTAVFVLRDCMTDKTFDQFIQMLSKEPQCEGLTLESLLLLPVQHSVAMITTYEELLRWTWPDHPDYAQLSKLVLRLQALTNGLSNRIQQGMIRSLADSSAFIYTRRQRRSQEELSSELFSASAAADPRHSFLKLLHLQQSLFSIPTDLLTLLWPGRRYVCEASVQLVDDRRIHEDGQLHLLGDAILTTTTKKSQAQQRQQQKLKERFPTLTRRSISQYGTLINTTASSSSSASMKRTEALRSTDKQKITSMSSGELSVRRSMSPSAKQHQEDEDEDEEEYNEEEEAKRKLWFGHYIPLEEVVSIDEAIEHRNVVKFTCSDGRLLCVKFPAAPEKDVWLRAFVATANAYQEQMMRRNAGYEEDDGEDYKEEKEKEKET